ncbi:MAG: adaptor protein MecA [Oscillospiraceae bacterium]
MKIDLIGAATVKVEISKEELGQYGVQFDDLDGGGDGARALLTELLIAVKTHSGFEFDDGRLFVEAFEADDGSVVIYISQVGLKNNQNESLRESDEAGTGRPPKGDSFRSGSRYRPVKKEKAGETTPALKTTVCEFDDFGQLFGFARAALEDGGDFITESELYADGAQKYRLVLRCSGKPARRFAGLLDDFSHGAGEILAAVTAEHCTLLVPARAIETLTGRDR